ncbi:hypothetical protein QX204_34160 (plasmid) [Nocardia sp. PE-7]|uniref:hypothetical protein n=1 Tax=Nocardia sp. PE-7 TaxID=3058426 RepID=UPI00265955FA|nr:hypothetical protein [Nocardia sp. PE-7]WKG13599.1 hypothetical protein QX204_34160 [Nocardia sp. PE-7]
MLYLIRPQQTVDWVDLPHHFADVAAEYGEPDMALFNWGPVEQFGFHSTVVRLALRFGIPCSTGIVVRGTDLVPFTWLLDVAKLAETPVRSQDLPNEDLMETLMPGWKQESRNMDERVAAAMTAKATELREDLDEELNKPTVPELVQHWRNLGGVLPDPI